jgi:hypothetical protein
MNLRCLEILEVLKDSAKKWIDFVPCNLYSEPFLSRVVKEVSGENER